VRAVQAVMPKPRNQIETAEEETRDGAEREGVDVQPVAVGGLL